MSRSSYTQSGFLGGEWSPLAQGRFDHPFYHQALSTCRNAIIIEEAPWTRRCGLETMGPTYGRTAAKLYRFQSNAAFPFVMEFTSDKLRFWYGTGPVCTNDRQVITASSSVSGTLHLTTTTAHGWAVGDHFILFTPTTLAAADIAIVRGRHFKIATASGSLLTANDDLGNPLLSDIASSGLNGATAIRIKRFDSTGITTAMLPNVRVVQAQTQALVLSGLAGIAPQVAQVTTEIVAGVDTDPVLTFGAATFKDGPYLKDAQPDTGTVSAFTGTITFAPASTIFVAADVGRLIRLFSQPADWASGTTYTNGQYATYPPGSSEWWIFTYSSGLAGVIPGTSYTTGGVTYLPWAPAPSAGQWAWGTISAQATTSCTVVLQSDLNSANGTTVSTWYLGLYKSGQYPGCGIYHEGRIWLAGAVRNEFAFSMTNLRPPGTTDDGSFWFSPTDVNGNVLDNSGAVEHLNFDDLSDIYWMKPDHQGIIVGTNGGEILISASALNDPITPTSIQAHRVTVEMCANVEPVRAGIGLVLVQRYQRRILEHMADAFSGKFSAKPLNELALHLSDSGCKELAYQHEKAPIIWALMNDGTLAGCSYRRVSRFVSEPPVMNGWHSHPIADGAVTVNSMCVTPGVDGLSDTLYLNTLDGNGDYWIETMRPIFEEA